MKIQSCFATTSLKLGDPSGALNWVYEVGRYFPVVIAYRGPENCRSTLYDILMTKGMAVEELGEITEALSCYQVASDCECEIEEADRRFFAAAGTECFEVLVPRKTAEGS